MNKTLLQLNTSIYSDNGQSTRLAREVVAGWRRNNPGATTIVRDLAVNPLPHITAERFQAFITKLDERTPAQQSIVAESDGLVSELQSADVIVLTAPMYNFGVPSTLKAWFDHVARAGVTFRYTPQGAVGLLTGKKAYVVSTRGGLYAGTPSDNETPFIRQFLGFLGITDVEFVYAEGLAISEESRVAGIHRAQRAIERLGETASERLSEAELEPLAA